MKNSLFSYLLKKIYFKIQLLSIDVAVGTSCISAFIFTLLNTKINYTALLTLALVVWLIYTLDHLVDAIKIKFPAVLPRHYFHQKNFKILFVVWIIVAFLTLIIAIYFLPQRTLLLGLVGCVLVLIYFLTLQIKVLRDLVFFQKEIAIATIYTIGVFIPPISLNTSNVSLKIVVSFCQIFLFALINLIEFSFFEAQADKEQGQISLATLFGRDFTKGIVYFLIVVNYILSITSFSLFSRMGVQISFALMNTVLLVIMYQRKYFEVDQRYRVMGDAIFLIPVIVVIIDSL